MVITKNNWTPIQLDGSVFVNGADGLIGIEECTDYDLNQFVTKQPRKSLNTVKKKKPVVIKKDIVVEEIHLTPSKTGSTAIDQPEENLENLQAWAHFGLPKSLLQGLAEQSFTEPTEIQQLTLPAAVLGSSRQYVTMN